MTDWDQKVKADGKSLKKKYIVAGKNQLVYNDNEQRYRMFDQNGNLDEQFSKDMKTFVESCI